MNLPTGWDSCGLSNAAWAELALRMRAELARRLRRQDDELLLSWGRHYLAHYFRRPPSKMHLWLAEQLDAMSRVRGTRLNVIGPRGGAKSTLGTLAHVLRAAVEGWEPYIWIVSDSAQQACGHLAHIKTELLNNPLLAADYPRATGRGRVWRSAAVELANGVSIEALGTLQRIRGRRHGAHRPTLIVCDDLQNDQHMRSPGEREKSRRWFEGSLLPAGNSETNIVHLATALHREALALLLHKTPAWTSRVFSAIERWPDNMSLWQDWEKVYCRIDAADHIQAARDFYDERRAAMDAGAELLWPEEEDLYTLMRMRVDGGRNAFEREKQGAPLSPEMCEWPEEYFDEAIWFDEWPRELPTKIVSLDPSKGRDDRRGDYSAFVLLGVDPLGYIYVEADLARRPTNEIVSAGAEHCQNFRPQAFCVEANQYQQLLADEFAAEFLRRKMYGLHPWSIDNRVNKLVRIRRLTPLLSDRKLRFKAGSAGTRLLVDQLRDFPHGDHDDGPDALEMAARLATDLSHVPEAGDGLGNRLIIG